MRSIPGVDRAARRDWPVPSGSVTRVMMHAATEALGLNWKTVANHQSSVRQKLAAETTIELVNKKVNALGIA
jgi:hypothetical protein